MATRFRFEACLPAPESRRLGWLCSYTPEELIIAAGFAPYRLNAGEPAATSAESLLTANLCPYVRSLLDSARTRRYDDLYGIIFVSSCDAMRRLADIWLHYLQTPFSHRLDIPRRTDELAENFLIEQLRQLRAALEGETGRRISDDDIARAIDTVNRTRQLVSAISQLRLDPSPAISGSKFYAIARCGTLADKRRFNAEAQRFINALGSDTGRRTNGARLLLCGCVIEDPTLPRLIEECGGMIVADDHCTGLRHYEGLVDTSLEPIRGIARRYLQRASCARMLGAETRVRRVLALAREYRAVGVVYHTLKFCDLVQADLPRLTETLRRQGIPLLHIERDSISASSGQLKTRLEAFIEVLGKAAKGAG